MKENQPFQCKEDMDLVHHQLIEQIARISVEEEEEAMREERLDQRDNERDI